MFVAKTTALSRRWRSRAGWKPSRAGGEPVDEKMAYVATLDEQLLEANALEQGICARPWRVGYTEAQSVAGEEVVSAC